MFLDDLLVWFDQLSLFSYGNQHVSPSTFHYMLAVPILHSCVMAFSHLLNVYGKSKVKLLFLSEHCYLHFHPRAWEFWEVLPHPNNRKVTLGIILFLSRVHKMTNTITFTPPPHSIWALWILFLVSLLRPACAATFKAKSRGDRGLKAINNQMLSEPHWRKRMQLYEQDPGLRQTAVCFRSLWGPAWNWETGGVAW